MFGIFGFDQDPSAYVIRCRLSALSEGRIIQNNFSLHLLRILRDFLLIVAVRFMLLNEWHRPLLLVITSHPCVLLNQVENCLQVFFSALSVCQELTGFADAWLPCQDSCLGTLDMVLNSELLVSEAFILGPSGYFSGSKYKSGPNHRFILIATKCQENGKHNFSYCF